MLNTALPAPLVVETVLSDGARIVRFQRAEILSERNVHELGEGLSAVLSGDTESTHFVIDFAGVQLVSSAALAKLILFQRRIRARGGEMTLCRLHPYVARAFRVSNLLELFSIQSDLDAALACAAATP